EPGQMWSIKSDEPTTAKIVVGRVEPWRDRVAVHVSVVDVPIPAGMPGAGGKTKIGHLPFDESALARAVERLVKTGVASPEVFESGYEQWKSANGGIFTIPVTQAISIVFDNLRSRQIAPASAN